MHGAPPGWAELRRCDPLLRFGPNNPPRRVADTRRLQHHRASHRTTVPKYPLGAQVPTKNRSYTIAATHGGTMLRTLILAATFGLMGCASHSSSSAYVNYVRADGRPANTDHLRMILAQCQGEGARGAPIDACMARNGYLDERQP